MVTGDMVTGDRLTGDDVVTGERPFWEGRPPPAPRRLVVVSPHPDDEVFGAAGLMTWSRNHGAVVEIVAVTDGEGSHAASKSVSRDELRLLRAHERRCALAVLDLVDIPVHRLGLEDGALSRLEDGYLADVLVGAIDRQHTTLAVPSRHDVHPDHLAIYRAGRAVGARLDCAVWEYAVWARVDPSASRPLGRVLHLGADLHRRKVTAARAFRSQILPMGPDPSTDGPVLDDATVAAFVTPIERIRVS